MIFLGIHTCLVSPSICSTVSETLEEVSQHLSRSNASLYKCFPKILSGSYVEFTACKTSSFVTGLAFLLNVNVGVSFLYPNLIQAICFCLEDQDHAEITHYFAIFSVYIFYA